MVKSHIILFISFSFAVLGQLNAYPNYPIKPSKINELKQRLSARADCAPSTSSIDMSINNVRARLLGGGDVWWDLQNGKYIVPKVTPGSGVPEVSAIFAGAVWLGGYDPVGNLKLAAQTYRTGNRNDFWPGPLDPNKGTIGIDTCAKWDRHFQVLGENISIHIKAFNEAVASGNALDCKKIPEDILGWPARGNPYFKNIHGFDLPNTSQGLAGFYDQDGDGLYNPCNGDYPIIEIRGCNAPQYPDEMTFWIYNDAGGIHTQTQGKPIQMEIQVQAFAYATNDEINNMTFQRYKLINRATQSIDSTFFAMYVDPDLGCHTDDYIGCDVSRSLAYVYNEDATDGETGCSCPGGINTYCNNIPILGVDYFRGPLDEKGKEIGMSSFTYYNNAAIGNWPNAMTDPDNAQEYYNYMSGSWKDGTPFSFGGTAYQIGAARNDFAFTDAPNVNSGWSMCTANLDFGDRRTIQASGPFRLDPGAVNELIIGVVWVPDVDYPCPSIDRLTSADDLAQALFDNCFDITDGPDAPDMDFIELDQELIVLLTNDEIKSNNAREAYQEVDLLAPKGITDSLYRFEGYKIFQLKSADVGISDIEDVNKARLIYQVDVKNGVSNIYNWKSVPDPNSTQPIWIPEIKVEGQDIGIRHSFQIKEDQFATNDRTLVNHKKYYFTAIAYAYNSFLPFNARDVIGQRTPYLEGRRNIRTYVPTPRPIVNTSLQSTYGNGAEITRLDGIGAGGNFLDMSDETKKAIAENKFDGKIKYKPGRGPIQVKVYNPLDIKDGEFILTFTDLNPSNNQLDPPVRWRLVNTQDPNSPILSETSLDKLNEQLVAKYGFSVTLGQTLDAGDTPQGSNGAIGSEIVYKDASKPKWFTIIPNGNTPLNYIKTGKNGIDFLLDQKSALSTMGGGTSFVPFYLTDFRVSDAANPYISPSWMDLGDGFRIMRENVGFKLQNLNNVDIVLTPDKTLWSRCVVVETASPYYFNTTVGLGINTLFDTKNMDLRKSPSVGKEDANGDGIADPDNDGVGMSWFPGYAIDVETGKRLNIFFGENTVFDGRLFLQGFDDQKATGGDMMWNPTSQAILQTGGAPTLFNYLLGGQHFIYVTSQEYDQCKDLRTRLTSGGSILKKIPGLRDVSWTGVPMVTQGQKLLPYKDGLIPNEVTIKMRVDNAYNVSVGTNSAKGYPSYMFNFSGQESQALNGAEIPAALKRINMVPNPYYAYSAYETTQFSNIVKITNLPAKCNVTIYSLDGRFIRQYKRDEKDIPIKDRNNPAVLNTRYAPDLEWDMKNAKGIPIASGVYLVHIAAEGIGETTIKWFNVNRKFDPTGL
ncbi:MAG: hypothetical protein IPP04_04280 [Saprospiraceae bacterium]|nr:hypothetical protein [Saprospiraceae bacterium]